MANNIFDYMFWRGDLSFSEREFNDVDGVILARLSYLPFELIMNQNSIKEITIAEMAKKLIAYPNIENMVIQKEDIQFLKESRRVSFIKDTCCDREQIKQRAALTKGSAIRLYNANAATLLDSLRWGYVGYSGVMANFHPRLYSWLIQHKNEPMAETVQDYLAIASLIECRDYPVVCKRYLQRFEKIPMLPFSRVLEDRQPDSVNAELDALYRMTKTVEAALLTDMAQ